MDIIQQLELLAEKLGDLREEVVVVGGCSPALILDMSTAPDLRPTDDVDILVQTESYGKYNDFIEEIKKRGFVEKLGDRIGRFRCGELVVDLRTYSFSEVEKGRLFFLKAKGAEKGLKNSKLKSDPERPALRLWF